MNKHKLALIMGVAYAALQSFAMAQVPGVDKTDARLSSTDARPSSAESREVMIKGSDRVVGEPKTVPVAQGAAHSFKFEEAPVQDVVHVVLREVLKADYVLHPPLAGTVTMSTRAAVSADQALALLEGALQANGLVLARDTRGVFHVGKSDAMRGIVAAPRLASSTALPPGYGAIIVPLQYIGANEMAAILRPMLPAEALIRVDNVRNLLILAGTRAQAEGWLQLVASFDIDILKGMSVGLFPLKHASVREVDAALRLLGGTGSAPASQGGSTPPRPAAPSSAPALGQAGAAQSSITASAPLPETFPLYGALRVLPIERLNSVLIVTPRAHYLDEARRWIEKIDQPGLGSGEPQLFVYRVQNASARHLADVLNGVFGGASSGGGSAGSGVAPSLAQSTAGTMGAPTAGVRLASNSSAANTANNTNRPQVTSSTIGQTGLRVVADEINNAVLIYGTPSEYQRILDALKRLDLPPTQVMIEASIIEVTLTDDLKYGLQWTFSDSRSGGYQGTGVLSNSGGGALGGALAGFSYTLTNRLGSVQAVLNALATKSLVKIISNPSLMVLDNHTAQITVGNQQPIRTSETVSETGASRTSSIQYKDTGVMLSVQPSVNAGDIVTMNINQAVTDVGEEDDATGQRAFLQRQIISKVAVRSGEAIVLGGLIRDNTTNGKAGIPGFQDVPVLGALFGNNTRNTNRTELLVVITPRVIRTDVDAAAISEELRDKMRGIDLGSRISTAPLAAETNGGFEK